jgi:glycosyltransferase involved in cell wall biosynthesis
MEKTGVIKHMIYIVDIESIPTRYSTQWRSWIPNFFKDRDIETTTISGTDYSSLTSGGFFDFVRTNKYKSEQVIKIVELFDTLKNGDKFLFTDVWHPGIISLKYMLDLTKKDINIYGLLHAGAYDDTDILGINNLGRWVDGFELSMLKACKKVFVATNYHKNIIRKERGSIPDNIIVSGFPYDFSELDKYKIPYDQKEKIIIFPHRLSPDKQPEIFDKLSEHFPEYQFIKTQDHMFSKDDYHKMLAKSKYVFSAALHENWGISVFESMYLGAIPILPDRCSYEEMYFGAFRYPVRYTFNNLVDWVERMLSTDIPIKMIEQNNKKVKDDFCNFNNILDEVIND